MYRDQYSRWLLTPTISAHPCTSKSMVISLAKCMAIWRKIMWPYDNICGNLSGNMAKSTDCLDIGILDVRRPIVLALVLMEIYILGAIYTSFLCCR